MCLELQTQIPSLSFSIAIVFSSNLQSTPIWVIFDSTSLATVNRTKLQLSTPTWTIGKATVNNVPLKVIELLRYVKITIRTIRSLPRSETKTIKRGAMLLIFARTIFARTILYKNRPNCYTQNDAWSLVQRGIVSLAFWSFIVLKNTRWNSLKISPRKLLAKCP